MIPAGGTLVDVGCGACQITTHLAAYFDRVLGIDFSPTMLEAAQRRIDELAVHNIELMLGTMQQFPFPIRNADVVLSYGVCQYLSLADLRQHLDQVDNVLSPAGTACLALVPNSEFRSWYRLNILGGKKRTASDRLAWRATLLYRMTGALLARNLLWDGIGNWFSRDDIENVADRCGFDVDFRHCWFYEYRFHALLRRKNLSRRE